MAYSSILGADVAPAQPSGRESGVLGPSDNSDSGSDTVGTWEEHSDSDAAGTGERGVVAGADAIEGADIMPDRVVNLADGVVDGLETAVDFTDLDDDAGEAGADGEAAADDAPARRPRPDGPTPR